MSRRAFPCYTCILAAGVPIRDGLGNEVAIEDIFWLFWLRPSYTGQLATSLP
jgi:hypothetical protein